MFRLGKIPAVRSVSRARDLVRQHNVQTKTRPVKIKLGSLEQKEKVIEASYSKVRKSKKEICQRLYFQRDLTYRQRQEEYERRAKRRQRPPTGPVADRGCVPDRP